MGIHRLLSLLLALPLAAVSLGFQDWKRRPRSDGFEAREWLLRSLSSARAIDVSAVVLTRFGPGDFATKVRVEQSSAGVTRHTVLEPSPAAGSVTVDDGKTWWSYLPRARRIFVQDSPRRHQDLPSYQTALACQNYELRIRPGPPVAGRPTLRVVAIPRSREMPIRDHFLDLETAYLLRLVVAQPDGTRKVPIDTLEVDFSPKLDPKALRELPKDVPTVRMESPKRLARPSDAKRETGFSPLLPKSLPAGFMVKEVQLVGQKDRRFVAVRLVDGLTTVTVYQWKPGTGRRGWPFDMPFFREAEGVRLSLVGDVPKSVSDALLDAFVRG